MELVGLYGAYETRPPHSGELRVIPPHLPAPGTLVPSAGIIIYEGRTLSKRVNQKGGSDGRETKKRGDQAAGT